MLGARRKLHLKGRTFAERRLNPNAPTVHLDDLPGNGEPEARAALGFGKGAVNLVELLEYARLLLRRDPRSRVRHADGEVTVNRLRRDAHFTRVGKFDGVADEVKEHLGQALLIAEANGQGVRYFGLERELLVLRKRFGGGAHRLDHARDRIFAHV